MISSKSGASVLSITALFLFSMCSAPPKEKATSPATYDELVSFFKEWRKFAAPEMKDGVPDYSVEAMKKQHTELSNWQQSLNNFDTTKWPIKHQVDWYLVWAEMNGLDFEHRVQQPWVKDPGFYIWFYPSLSDVPEREAPNVYGAIELPDYVWPLSEKDAAEIAARLRKAPAVFDAAKNNLTGNAKDLWVTGIRSIHEASGDLDAFAESVKTAFPDLALAAKEAREASEKFAGWLSDQASSKTGSSGVGKENFSWNLNNVHIVPYNWNEEKILVERELYRSHSALRFVEHRNRKLPQLPVHSDAKNHADELNKGVTEYMEFLDKDEFLTVEPYMDPAMRAQIRAYYPVDSVRIFFDQIDHRDPMPMRAHHYHWIELARNKVAPNDSPIRAVPLLSNIFDTRAEGFATAMEELIMNAGLLKDRPRAMELTYIMLAQRCARALGGLYQHGLEMDFKQATEFASKWVPRGYAPADGATLQHEEQFYLQQPGYEASYVIGKLQFDQLVSEYARQRNDDFVLKEFMDKFNRVGIIPMSLVYWEMTGDRSMVDRAVGRNK